MNESTIQYFINPFLLGFSGLIYIRLKIELNIMYESIPSVPMPPPPGLTPGHLTFFFGQIPHHAGPFFGQMPPSLGTF